MISQYLAEELFADVSYLRLGFTARDMSQATIGTLTDYDEFQPSDIGPKDIFAVLESPSLTKYNVLCGYTENDVLVFLTEVSIEFLGITINSIEFNISIKSKSVEISFDLVSSRQFLQHSHNGINLNVIPVDKFTTYLGELIDDGDRFSKGGLIRRTWLSDFTGFKVLDPELNPKSLSEITGVFGVDFRFEHLPSKIISNLSDSLRITEDNLTYRGDLICYRKSGEYKVVKGSITFVFTNQITLVNEYTILEYNGLVTKVKQWTTDRNWIEVYSTESPVLVYYRSVFIRDLDNSVIYKLI